MKHKAFADAERFLTGISSRISKAGVGLFRKYVKDGIHIIVLEVSFLLLFNERTHGLGRVCFGDLQPNMVGKVQVCVICSNEGDILLIKTQIILVLLQELQQAPFMSLK